MDDSTQAMLAQQKRFDEAEHVIQYSGYSTIVAEHIRLTSPEPDFKPDNTELKRLLKVCEFVRHSNFYVWHEGRLQAVKDDPRPLANG